MNLFCKTAPVFAPKTGKMDIRVELKSNVGTVYLLTLIYPIEVIACNRTLSNIRFHKMIYIVALEIKGGGFLRLAFHH